MKTNKYHINTVVFGFRNIFCCTLTIFCSDRVTTSFNHYAFYQCSTINYSTSQREPVQRVYSPSTDVRPLDKLEKFDKNSTAQRKMKRAMLGVTLRDRKRTNWIRQQTGVIDVIQTIRQGNHRWAGHVMRRGDNRWTTRVTEWVPRRHKRSRGRPRKR